MENVATFLVIRQILSVELLDKLCLRSYTYNNGSYWWGSSEQLSNPYGDCGTVSVQLWKNGVAVSSTCLWGTKKADSGIKYNGFAWTTYYGNLDTDPRNGYGACSTHLGSGGSSGLHVIDSMLFDL